MKLHLLFAALLMTALSGSSAFPADKLMGKTLEEAQKLDFFTFFHLEQTDTATDAQKQPVVTFKPGSDVFRELATVKVTLDDKQVIQGMELSLARSFVDHATYGIFARDFAKSMLRDMLSEADETKAEDLLNEIQLGHSAGTVIGGGEAPKLPDLPTAGYRTFLGERESYRRQFEKAAIKLQNEKSETEGELLVITVRAKAGEPRGLTDDDYTALFLAAEDFPEGLAQAQDARSKGPDPGDKKFAELGGKRAGFAVWSATGQNVPMARIVDIRFVFPDEAAAQNYLEASLSSLSEGAPEAKDAPQIGEACYLFGPENERINKALGVNLRAYVYAFRQHNVVVKLFVAQGLESTEQLQPNAIAPLAEKIVGRIADGPASRP